MTTRADVLSACVAAPRVATLFVLLSVVPLNVAAQSFSPPASIRADAATESDADRDPRIATSGHGTWVATWTSVGADGDADILVARSVDGGATWSSPLALDAANDDYSSSGARLATDGAGIWVVVWQSSPVHDHGSGTDSDVFFARSIDDGATWSAPAVLHVDTIGNEGDGNAAITTDGAGTWVVVWLTGDAAVSPFHLAVSRSFDGGMTWSSATPVIAIPSSPVRDIQLPDIATANGTWLIVWSAIHVAGSSSDIDSDIAFARSTDAGATWSAPAALNTNAAVDGGYELYPHVVGDGTGAWVASWTRSGSEDDAFVARSLDDGLTWADPLLLNINASSGDLLSDGDPRVITDRHGTWFAIWNSTDRLGGANPFAFPDPVLARSTDGGATWSAPSAVNTDVSSFPCDQRQDHDANLTTDGQGTFVAVWGRARNFCHEPPVRPDDDVMTAHVSTVCGNGVLELDEECDDGNLTPEDGCAANCRFEPCRPLLVDDCRTADTAKASLQATNLARREVEWKWTRGTVATGDLGDPTLPGDDYYFCVYQEGHLVALNRVAAAGLCGTRPCWDRAGSGYEFRQVTRRPKSTVLLQVKPSAEGRSRLRFRTRGVQARLPLLPASGPIVVQLRRPSGPICWGATFSEPFLRNEAGAFFGRSD